MRQTALDETNGDRQRLDVVPTRLDAPAADGVPANAPVIVATNVVPFTRARRDTSVADGAAAVALDPAGRPAPYWPTRDRRILALLVLSLLVHGGLYFVFNRPAEPMISIGVEAVSVELVPGTNTPVGAATDPGEQQAQTAPEPEQKPDETTKAEEQPPPVEDTKPAEDTPPTDVAAVEPKPEPVVETPPEPPAETPPEQVAAPPPEPAPPEPKPAEPPKPEVKPQPVQHHETKPKQPAARPKAEHQKTASREAERPGPRANAASGTGAGRSQSYSNWMGLVYAHLARYQRANQSNQGLVVVRFSLDASGRVTSVSVARSSGFANLDAEAQAAVRRASPFPPPPLGTSSVTAPIRYRSAS